MNTYEWHTSNIRIHTSVIRVHTDTYKWHKIYLKSAFFLLFIISRAIIGEGDRKFRVRASPCLVLFLHTHSRKGKNSPTVFRLQYFFKTQIKFICYVNNIPFRSQK